MVRVNKRQKQILNCLNKTYPNSLAYEVLLAELGNDPKNIVFLKDLQLKGLVGVSWNCFGYQNGATSHETPYDSWIKPEGRVKLRENFFAKFMLFMLGIVAATILVIIKMH